MPYSFHNEIIFSVVREVSGVKDETEEEEKRRIRVQDVKFTRN